MSQAYSSATAQVDAGAADIHVSVSGRGADVELELSDTDEKAQAKPGGAPPELTAQVFVVSADGTSREVRARFERRGRDSIQIEGLGDIERDVGERVFQVR